MTLGRGVDCSYDLYPAREENLKKHLIVASSLARVVSQCDIRMVIWGLVQGPVAHERVNY